MFDSKIMVCLVEQNGEVTPMYPLNELEFDMCTHFASILMDEFDFSPAESVVKVREYFTLTKEKQREMLWILCGPEDDEDDEEDND